MHSGKKLFVGGLPATLNLDMFLDIFQDYTPHVRVQLKMREDNPNLNVGYGFLIVDDHSLVKQILTRQFVTGGRLIQVQKTNKKTKEPKASTQNQTRVYLKGIPQDTTDAQLLDFFKQFASVRAAYSIADVAGQARRFGYIEVDNLEEANMLLEIKTFNFNGIHMVVEPFRKASSNNMIKKNEGEGSYQERSSVIEPWFNSSQSYQHRDTPTNSYQNTFIGFNVCKSYFEEMHEPGHRDPRRKESTDIISRLESVQKQSEFNSLMGHEASSLGKGSSLTHQDVERLDGRNRILI